MQDYRKLEVWARAHELVLETYRAAHGAKARAFPDLTGPMLRMAGAIPAAIVEGCGYDSQRELAGCLRRAIASAQQLQYHLVLARDLDVVAPAQYARLDARVSQVCQMTSGLLRRVRRPAAAITPGGPGPSP